MIFLKHSCPYQESSNKLGNTSDTAVFSSKVCLHDTTEQFDDDLTEGNKQVLEVAESAAGTS